MADNDVAQALQDSVDRFTNGMGTAPTPETRVAFEKIFQITVGKFLTKGLATNPPLRLWSDVKHKAFKSWVLNKAGKVGRVASALADPKPVTPELLEAAATTVFQAAKKCQVRIKKGKLVFVADEKQPAQAQKPGGQGDVCADYLATHV